MITPQLVVLGAVAGFTIFLGLPVAVMRHVSARAKGFLNAITIGVLIFILIEVLPEAKGLTEDAITKSGLGVGAEYVGALVLGLVIGMFSLVAYEMRFIRIRQRRKSFLRNSTSTQPQGMSEKQEAVETSSPVQAKSLGLGEAQAIGPTALAQSRETAATIATQVSEARQIALSIAIGIGVHNFSEGLAIGQSYTSLALSFTYLLILGFAIHNSTEGFGIAAPMTGYRPRLSYLFTLGFIGGFPTLLGTIVGSMWTADYITLTFILALAAGALIYIISGMFYVARRQTSNELFILGLFVGFMIAYGTDLWLTMLGA